MQTASIPVTNRQRAVLVLGAGRSGTSLVARAIQTVGVDLGNNLKRPSRKNPTGFFEDNALLALSKRLRRALRLRPDSLRLLDDTVWSEARIVPFYDRFARTIRCRFGNAPVWGFKYARTLRLLPFWQRLFESMGIQPIYVMAIRNPLSVAHSRAQLDEERGQQEQSDLEWLVNVVPYFPRLQGYPLVVVDYDRLMAEPREQLERLATQLNLPMTVKIRNDIDNFAHDFVRGDLRHSRFTVADLDREPILNPLVRDAYRWLDRLASDEIAPTEQALWKEWEVIAAEVTALAPLLRRLDYLAGKLRRAQWNPLSPFGAAWEITRCFLRSHWPV